MMFIGTSKHRLPVGIVHRCRMHWPPGSRGIQFAIHLAPGWHSLHDSAAWRWNLTLDVALWRLDIGIGRA
jgi:hypothetical protein